MKGFKRQSSLVWVIVGFLCQINALAKLEDADNAADKARQAAVEHFEKFQLDKNVIGRPKKVDGSYFSGGDKTRFNNDDGIQYTSVITSHAVPYWVREDKPKASPPPGISAAAADAAAKKEKAAAEMAPLVSKHGSIDASGGSSELERKIFEFHQQYTNEEETEAQREERRKQNQRTESIFIVSEKDVKPQNAGGGTGGGGAGGGAPDEERKETTELYVMRPEVKEAVEEIGKQSADTVKEAAKYETEKDNPEVLSDGLALRMGALMGVKSWIMETVSKLAQRRANRTIRSGVPGTLDLPQLSEDNADCEAAITASVQKAMQKIGNDPSGKKAQEVQKESQRQIEQCKQITKLGWYKVAPVFNKKDPNDSSKGEELQSDGIDKEDGIQRDYRNQMEVLLKPGKKLQDLEANIEYREEQGKNDVVIEFDENAQAKSPVRWTPAEQMEDYNKQLETADKALPEVNERLGQYAVPEFKASQYKLDPENTPYDRVLGIPQPVYEETFGVKKPEDEKPPESYDDVLSAAKQQ